MAFLFVYFVIIIGGERLFVAPVQRRAQEADAREREFIVKSVLSEMGIRAGARHSDCDCGEKDRP